MLPLAVQSANNVIPPIANAGTNQIADPGAIVTFNASGSTANVPAAIAGYAWSQTAGPNVTLSNANTNHANFTIPIPTASGTTYTFQLIVTDDGGLSSNASTVNVTVNNAAPVISPIGNKIVVVGGPLNFTVTATDPNSGNAINVITSPTPTGATFTPATGVFSWPNASPIGVYSITFTASKTALLTSTQTISISVRGQSVFWMAREEGVVSLQQQLMAHP